jgi:Fe-S cluster assembly protein SufD
VNKNILLSDDAEVDSQPMLEIFADDVQCTHGAAVGRLDPNAVFYLNSRGLDAREAQEVLVHGFVSEVLEAVADDAIRQYTDDAVLTKLG